MAQIGAEVTVKIESIDDLCSYVREFGDHCESLDKSINRLIDRLPAGNLITGTLEETSGAEDLIGARIRFGDMDWTVLEQDDDSLFMVANKLLPDEYQFDTKNWNVWAKSAMREELHQWLKEWAEENDVDKYIFPIRTESTNEASEVLGTSDDRVRLLTLEEQLRYRRLGLLPKYDDWQWTITAYRHYANYAWIVSTGGLVYATNAYNAYGCAPSVYISLEAPFERID